MFCSFSIDKDILRTNNNVLIEFGAIPALVVGGVWGATLSSALGGNFQDYVEKLILDLKNDNGKRVRPSNKRRVTNLGVFRRYIINYLRHYDKITNDHKNFPSIVGEKEPNEKGVGISILAYYDGTDVHGYNNAIGNIFDHLFAVIHEFDLDFYQLPSDSMTHSKDKSLSYVSQD